MDIINISEAIQNKIKLLRETREKLQKAGEEKARAISEYDKQLALALMGLKNGKEYTIDNVSIQNPPAASVEKIAKGIVYQARLNMEVADNAYKSLITEIGCIESELSALQSLFKNLSEA